MLKKIGDYLEVVLVGALVLEVVYKMTKLVVDFYKGRTTETDTKGAIQ